MNGCAMVRELLGGHVLGALDADETARVDHHLETCARCRREREELAGLPALLDLAGAADAEPEAPRPALEEAVLDRFARERRHLSSGAGSPLLRGRVRLGLAVGGAVAVAAVALVLSGALSSAEEGEAFGHVDLQGGRASAEADLRAVREGTRVDLSVAGLPPGPKPVYELWCIPDEGRWISGGTFRADAQGSAHVRLTSAAKPGDYERIVITAGSRRPGVLAGGVVY